MGNRHLQKTLLNKSRIHILLKHTWNILQDRPYPGLKTKLSKFKRMEIIQNTFSGLNSMKLEINNKKKLGKVTNNTDIK